MFRKGIEGAHGVVGLSRSLRTPSRGLCERCPVQFRMCPQKRSLFPSFADLSAAFEFVCPIALGGPSLAHGWDSLTRDLSTNVFGQFRNVNPDHESMPSSYSYIVDYMLLVPPR